ncbi:hypothetical protein NPIL_73651 [Nephila pilipes]|uniref:Uncharacterized protein n=1 Tax=Nephila pilipes TaxID=299642 RepID=A0A8X6QNS6_NEPPI|nr:hypothetical protein NPIL_73651 [Nephila pilipes]
MSGYKVTSGTNLVSFSLFVNAIGPASHKYRSCLSRRRFFWFVETHTAFQHPCSRQINDFQNGPSSPNVQVVIQYEFSFVPKQGLVSLFRCDGKVLNLFCSWVLVFHSILSKVSIQAHIDEL